MSMRRRSMRAVPAFALLLAVSGCVVEVLGLTLYGPYDLAWANGRGVPAAVYFETTTTGSYTLEVVSGTLDLHHDGTFSLNVGIRETDHGVVSRWTEAYGGDWQQSGRDVYLYYVDPGTNRDQTISGVVRDGSVELLVSGIVTGAAVQLGFER
jgi:hypothetical protein